MFDNNHFNFNVTCAKPYFCHHVQVFGGFSYWSQRCFMEELVGFLGLWWSHRPIHGLSKSLVVFHIDSGDLSILHIKATMVSVCLCVFYFSFHLLHMFWGKNDCLQGWPRTIVRLSFPFFFIYFTCFGEKKIVYKGDHVQCRVTRHPPIDRLLLTRSFSLFFFFFFSFHLLKFPPQNQKLSFFFWANFRMLVRKGKEEKKRKRGALWKSIQGMDFCEKKSYQNCHIVRKINF
jgi:hypothetical protein